MKKNICLYCSSSDAIDKKYFYETEKLCMALSRKEYDLVYGGGNLGLMGHVARTFKKANRFVIGVIPEKLHNKGITYDGVDDLIVSNTMSERKMIMMERADAFISLPGGFGTLEEILEILTLKQLGYHNKAIVFYNSFGFYDFLIGQFEFIYKEKFAKDAYRNYYFVSDSPDEISGYLENYKHIEHIDKWFK